MSLDKSVKKVIKLYYFLNLLAISLILIGSAIEATKSFWPGLSSIFLSFPGLAVLIGSSASLIYFYNDSKSIIDESNIVDKVKYKRLLKSALIIQNISFFANLIGGITEFVFLEDSNIQMIIFLAVIIPAVVLLLITSLLIFIFDISTI